MRDAKGIMAGVTALAIATVLSLGVAPPTAWGQSGGVLSNSSVAPAPNSSMAPPTQSNTGNGSSYSSEYFEMLPANQSTVNYVNAKIKQAEGQGMEVMHAKGQAKLGVAALDRGENYTAVEHFQMALMSIGVDLRTAEKELKSNSSGSAMPSESSSSSDQFHVASVMWHQQHLNVNALGARDLRKLAGSPGGNSGGNQTGLHFEPIFYQSHSVFVIPSLANS